MKAAVIDGYGGPERFEIREVEKPEVGPGQLLVRVRAASVNPVDWKMRRGQLRLVRPARFPLILGYDVAGEVEAVGPEVDAFDLGDPVYAFVDSRHGGAYAEHVLVGQAAAARKPDRLSFEEAAALPIAGLTAIQGLRDRGELEKGERLLVNGGTGGVGHLAIQIGRAMGASVTAVASGRNQELLRELGAVRGIDYEQEDFTTDEETFHVVFDTIGNSDLRECNLILEEGGVFVTTSIGPSLIAQTVISSVTGLFGPARRCRPVIVKPKGQDLAVLNQMVETGRLRPLIEEVYPLEQIAEAHRRSETGRVRGKLVIRVE